jgi:pyruvate kinase
MQKNRTKIVCTIGPSTWDPEVMKKVIEAGMDCARVNGAFADTVELDKVKKLVKDISNDVSLMVDVKGPEVRLNKFAAPIKLEPGMDLVVGNDSTSEVFPANYKDVYKYVAPGQRVVIGDGDVEFVVTRVEGENMHWQVVYGELLKPGKAMNLPGCEITSEVLTEKDKENLRHAIDTGWDFVSASFIQTADAARYIKKFMGETKMKLIAKIEDEEGVKNIDEILEVVDGVMIARGGLDVELGYEKVPMVQRLLIAKCKSAGKPVITATQMLESMITNPRPTRAEVNDVATAIILGTDAVMLSGESSAGKYPVEAVRTLTRIADEINPNIEAEEIDESPNSIAITTNAIARSAAALCIKLEKKIKKVVIITKTGFLARQFLRHVIKQPVYVYTSEEVYRRQILLSNNVSNAYIQEPLVLSRDKAIEILKEKVIKEGIAVEGEKVLFLSKTQGMGADYFPNLFEIIEL